MRGVVLTLFFLFLWAKPLPIEKAFKSEFIPKDNGVEFVLKIAPHVHIYKNSIKVLVDNKPYKVTFPKTKKDDLGEDIYEGEFKLFIPQKGEIKITYQGCSDEMVCYAPKTDRFLAKTFPIKQQKDEVVKLFDKSIWVILGSFFIFGVLLSLTPCIFPMIPILSGPIIKSSRHSFVVSLVYVLSMSIAYTIAGVLAGLFGSNLQTALQNPYVLGVFSLIFVFLAFSMFGFYEIGLPASLQTKLNKKSDEAGKKGGFLGIAIMGFLSALIVGPCVAPPLAGALIYIGQSGNALLGGSALFVMSLGMGMPLLLIGLGANKLLPKAGSWMMNVNKVFGVIMLGVAIWMISRVIPDNVTTILWAILFIGSGLYLNPFEKIENYKDTILKTIGFILIIVGGSLIFRSINPPTISHIQMQQWKIIKSIKDLENIEGDAIVDFTAKWCVSCKEYEEITFKDKEVIDKLKKYNLYRVDVTNNTNFDKKIMKKFSIVGPPAILIFKNGKLVKKIIGYKPPNEFLKAIDG